MWKRIVSSAVGIALLVTVLLVSDEYKYLFNGVVGLLSVISVGEIFFATKFINHKPLLIASMLFAAFVPFASVSFIQPYAGAVLFIYLVVLLSVMLRSKEKISLQEISIVFMLCTLIPSGFSMLVALRDLGLAGFGGMAKRDGIFLLLTACACAWFADTGAYFIGRFFGRHKLSPTVSPNKTVEGFVGGVVIDVIGMVVAAMIYQTYFSQGAVINLIVIGLLAFISAFLGTLGDLSASYIKRACHVKDFGHIMPGHGGIMDRFDSILLVAPFVYLMVCLLQNVCPLIIR